MSNNFNIPVSPAQIIANRLALTPFIIIYVTDDYSLRANVLAPNSFAARQAFLTLCHELEPGLDNLPETIGDITHTIIGILGSLATLECCLMCKGFGHMVRSNIAKQCTNCGGMGGFLTANDANIGIVFNPGDK